MKLTIEPTKKEMSEFGADCTTSTVTVELPSDDLTFIEVTEQLFKPALLGLGYHPDNVDQVEIKERKDE